LKVKLNDSFYFILLCTLLGCASRVAPDGGPRDKTSPEVVSTIPNQQALNIKPKKVEFEFNEFIQLKDGGSGILISPPLSNPPQALLQGKSLILKFDEELDDSTTYTITVSSSVADLTEGNLLEPYSFVFSTGNILDSLSCSGIVKDAFTGKAVKDALVLIYTSAEDSLPKTTLPRYFAKTNESGDFAIKNMKQGEYTVFALKDANSNYLYDQPGESIGFLDTTVKIDSQNVSIPPINLSVETPKKQRLIKSSFNAPFTLELKYALAPDSIKLRSFDGQKVNFHKSKESTPDSLQLHLQRVEGDSLKLYVYNSLGDSIKVDTLELKTRSTLAAGPKSKRKPAADTSLKVTTNIDKGKLLPSSDFEVFTSFPSSLSDSLLTFWRIENDTTVAQVKVGKDPYSFYAEPPPAQGRSVEFIALPGTFKDIYGNLSDTLRVDFRRMDMDETGNIELLFEHAEKDSHTLILEILDSKKKTIYQSDIQRSDSLFIKELSPGSYSLRVIEDKNSNGIWDPTNYDTKEQAESVYYYSEEIAVRAGWDISVEWINKKNKKIKLQE
jgi:uncharacterized protein (DUF2141 family)